MTLSFFLTNWLQGATSAAATPQEGIYDSTVMRIKFPLLSISLLRLNNGDTRSYQYFYQYTTILRGESWERETETPQKMIRFPFTHGNGAEPPSGESSDSHQTDQSSSMNDTSRLKCARCICLKHADMTFVKMFTITDFGPIIFYPKSITRNILHFGTKQRKMLKTLEWL